MVRNPTRAVRVGRIQMGGGAPIAVQSMAATRTQDIEATVRQVELIEAAGADLVRIAVDVDGKPLERKQIGLGPAGRPPRRRGGGCRRRHRCRRHCRPRP